MNNRTIEITLSDWDELEPQERFTDYDEHGNLAFYKIEQSKQEEVD